MFASPIWASPTVVRLEIWPARSSGGGAPPWSARVARGWPETPPTAKNPFGLKAVQNDPVRGPQVLENFLGF